MKYRSINKTFTKIVSQNNLDKKNVDFVLPVNIKIFNAKKRLKIS